MADQFPDTGRTSNGPEDRFMELVLRYFDDDLSDAELAELNGLLRDDPERRQRFAEYCARGCLIHETFKPEREGLLGTESGAPKQRREGTSKGRRGIRVVAAASILIAAAALWLAWPSAKQDEVSTIGTLKEVSGNVRVVTADGNSQFIISDVEIRTGDTVRTRGSQSTATLVYLDGTRLTLVGDTSLTCTDRGGKSVVVHQGTLAASVKPQPEGSPMVLATPTARLQVLGTQFLLEALPHQTDLSVTEGRVRLVRVKDGEEIDVPTGKRVKAVERTAMAVEDIPRPPDTWDVDFEHGLPKDFTRGEFIDKALPPGSKGAVRAISAEHGEDGVFFEIATPDMWYHGLFSVHDDSHFHFTFKMDRPQWVNVFLISRGSGPDGAYSVNYLFNELRFWPPRPGHWRTVSIPLSKFGKAGGPPGRLSANEVPYLVLFSSDADRGLVIDRMWVTRGGPGVVKYEDR